LLGPVKLNGHAGEVQPWGDQGSVACVTPAFIRHKDDDSVCVLWPYVKYRLAGTVCVCCDMTYGYAFERCVWIPPP
jgi:hypothetical protein